MTTSINQRPNTATHRSRVAVLVTLLAALGTVLGSLVTASPATAASTETNAVSWAQSKLGTTGYDGLCETFVEHAYGTSGRYATAHANYLAQAAAGRVHTEGTPPPGALVFFAPANVNGGAGHVEVSEGNGSYITSAARVQRVNLNWAGAPYLGWSYAPESWGGRSDTQVAQDTDNDATPDSTDRCPAVPGPASNHGCPVVGDFNADGKSDIAYLEPLTNGGYTMQV
ncbi:MAG TPA: hypothetical protein DCQ04_10300, partial [Actinobacteria bacterium]|nr:hypothetical protein [Actinomycetota bacterium]